MADQVGQVYDYIAEKMEVELELAVDPKPKSVASACFLSWGPEVNLNEHAAAVNIPNNIYSPQKALITTQSNDHDFKMVNSCVDYIKKIRLTCLMTMETGLKLSYLSLHFGRNEDLLILYPGASDGSVVEAYAEVQAYYDELVKIANELMDWLRERCARSFAETGNRR